MCLGKTKYNKILALKYKSKVANNIIWSYTFVAVLNHQLHVCEYVCHNR